MQEQSKTEAQGQDEIMPKQDKPCIGEPYIIPKDEIKTAKPAYYRYRVYLEHGVYLEAIGDGHDYDANCEKNISVYLEEREVLNVNSFSSVSRVPLDTSDSMLQAAVPLIRWMQENGHPHMKAIVDDESIELLSCELRRMLT